MMKYNKERINKGLSAEEIIDRATAARNLIQLIIDNDSMSELNTFKEKIDRLIISLEKKRNQDDLENMVVRLNRWLYLTLDLGVSGMCSIEGLKNDLEEKDRKIVDEW